MVVVGGGAGGALRVKSNQVPRVLTTNTDGDTSFPLLCLYNEIPPLILKSECFQVPCGYPTRTPHTPRLSPPQLHSSVSAQPSLTGPPEPGANNSVCPAPALAIGTRSTGP